MSRYFVPITKKQLVEKILQAAISNDCLNEYYDPTMSDFQAGSCGDKEVGPLAAIEYYDWNNITKTIKKDLSKVEFDLENVMLGKSYKYSFALHGYSDELDDKDTLNPIKGLVTLASGLTFLGLEAGGDWESPVFFIIYWDGKKLRGYIPTDGNPYNTSAKMAYGNNCEGQYEKPSAESDEENCMKRFGCSEPYPSCSDCNKIIGDINKRILIRP